MITNIYYRDITRTENLEAYLLEHTEGILSEDLKRDPSAILSVRVETTRHRTENRKPVFTCEITLKPSKDKKYFKARKSHENFYTCMNEAAHALKSMIRKSSDIKGKHGRHRNEFDHDHNAA